MLDSRNGTVAQSGPCRVDRFLIFRRGGGYEKGGCCPNDHGFHGIPSFRKVVFLA